MQSSFDITHYLLGHWCERNSGHACELGRTLLFWDLNKRNPIFADKIDFTILSRHSNRKNTFYACKPRATLLLEHLNKRDTIFIDKIDFTPLLQY